MRLLVLAPIAICLAAQDTATYSTSSTDVNGHPIDAPQITETKSKTAYERTERLRSINGRMVPLERIEERVISDDSSGRVLERIVHRFDQDGNPTPPEKSRIEEQKGLGQSTRIRITTYQTDINGNVQVARRSVTETRKSGLTETAETVIERPSINGSFEPVEKTSVVKTGSGAGFHQEAATYRQGGGGFYEALRVITERNRRGAGIQEQTAEYEIGSSGTLELHSQKTRTTAKRSDGSETEVLDTFGQSVPGIAGTADSGLKLNERETIERVVAADGSFHEISRVQRPDVSDPKVLGPSRVVAEVVCRGRCRE